MDKSKLILLIHTLKYLKLKQVYYRLFYNIRNKIFKKEYKKPLSKQTKSINLKDSFYNTNSFQEDNTFVFLNQSYVFKNQIDWNFDEYGKLWTYNLNYFDFLNQDQISEEQGLRLIKQYIDKDKDLKDGKDPYPISLRGINWIKFLSKYAITDEDIDQALYNHYQILIHNLEYHLLGNHLLENGYALYFGSYYFKDEILYNKAKDILVSELNEQVLNDGAHFELSPMYHQILLHRLLDCINLTQNNKWKEQELLEFLIQKAVKMLSWLEAITYSNGSIPMVNDSAYDIAPNSAKLFKYASNLGLQFGKAKLLDSGYRRFKSNSYELLVDIGNIGPDYQLAHAHSDTFNFELYKKQQPIIVDVGISTYEKNKKRQLERGTASHNTIKISNWEQSVVWGGFRVAQRAKVTVLKDEKNSVSAFHDGYKKNGINHIRTFEAEENKIIIKDKISKEIEHEQIAFFHFHPLIKNINIKNNLISLIDSKVDILFDNSGFEKVEVVEYDYCLGFNKTQKSKKAKVYFKNQLRTIISI